MQGPGMLMSAGSSVQTRIVFRYARGFKFPRAGGVVAWIDLPAHDERIIRYRPPVYIRCGSAAMHARDAACRLVPLSGRRLGLAGREIFAITHTHLTIHYRLVSLVSERNRRRSVVVSKSPSSSSSFRLICTYGRSNHMQLPKLFSDPPVAQLDLMYICIDAFRTYLVCCLTCHILHNFSV